MAALERLAAPAAKRRPRVVSVWSPADSVRPILVFAVVSAETEHAGELFIRHADAERFLEEVREDDAELAETLRLEAVELDA